MNAARCPTAADAWDLDPDVAHLNHGAFGACPRAVLDAQDALRRHIERNPMGFYTREYFDLIDAARERLAAFLGADPQGLVPVTNATAGVNSVLRSLDLEPGDELLVTDHAYNACRNALAYVAERAGATVRTVRLPFPVRDPSEVTEAVLTAVGPRTRLALIDHVTSASALVLPLADIVRALDARGVDTLVDGAHAPGMLPLALDALGAAYYTGNCHKWLCAPKGAGFLLVRADRRDSVMPLVVSHGINRRRPGRSAFHDAFDWAGTADPSPFALVPQAIESVGTLHPDGWPGVMAHNRDLVLRGREVVAAAVGTELPCPPSMVGSIATVVLPVEGVRGERGLSERDPVQQALAREHRIEVPVHRVGEPPMRVIRISGQLYNAPSDYERLAAALTQL
ncbi:MAG: aminotransferase class V-fold PLP-dependent enzyme [Chromatiales bacterium]|nr:aminotransferase class V-fold PLP-dependent enzyme [Chromatiales bacterium]